MRIVLLIVLALASQSVLAQSFSIEGPKSIQAGVPFTVRLALNDCSFGEAPPQTICEHSQVYFQTSDQFGSVPSQVVVVPNDGTSVAVGPFVMRSIGAQSITALSLYFQSPVAHVQVVVGTSQVPFLGMWGFALLVLALPIVLRLTIRSSGPL